jgi:predicted RNase H-like nuclease (RuvC/YqgF family)
MGFFTDILKEIPMNAVLREKLAEATAKEDALHKENADLRELIQQKDREIEALKKEVESFKQPKPGGLFGSDQRIKGRMER